MEIMIQKITEYGRQLLKSREEQKINLNFDCRVRIDFPKKHTVRIAYDDGCTCTLRYDRFDDRLIKLNLTRRVVA